MTAQLSWAFFFCHPSEAKDLLCGFIVLLIFIRYGINQILRFAQDDNEEEIRKRAERHHQTEKNSP
jgi:hypothetical protein